MRLWVVLGLIAACQSADPSKTAGKATSLATMAPPPASIDDSLWLGLGLLTGQHAPVEKVVVGDEGCVKDHPCPFVPTQLPPCPSSVVPLTVAEVYERFETLAQQGEPLTVKGTLSTGLRTTARACIPPGSCCNKSSGWMGLSEASTPRTLLITHISRSASGQADPTHFVSCAGDDSGVCCPLPLDTPVLARGWPYRLRLPGPNDLALAEVRLCRLSPKAASTEEPGQCEFEGLQYRDGATLVPPGRCVDCTCTRGAWQRQTRSSCLRFGPEPLTLSEKRELKKRVAAADARGLLGPYILVDDGLGEPSLEPLRAALLAAHASEHTISILPKGTATLPPSCQPEPLAGRELYFPPK